MGWGRWTIFLRAALVCLVLSGCVPALVSPPGAASPVTAQSTFTAIPTYTSAPPTMVPTISAQTQVPVATLPPATAAGKLYVVVSADNVNLRTRPGTVFPVSRLLAKGTRLELLGHAPGQEWLYVQADSQVYGWVLSWLVTGGHDGGVTPEVQPADVVLVQGKVVDLAGVPISGVGFAVTQGAGSTQQRTDATTDETGQFYAYLPAAASGTWLVSYDAIACTSNTMDSNCNCIGHCGRAEPQSVAISVPAQAVLQFVWK